MNGFVLKTRTQPHMYLASINPFRVSSAKNDAIRLANFAAAVKIANELNAVRRELCENHCFFASPE